jgi:hypothetical protein
LFLVLNIGLDFQALYGEVRQYITYVYENDGNTFRKVALSALLDSVRKNK